MVFIPKKTKKPSNEENNNMNEGDDIDKALEVEMGHVRHGSSDQGFLSNPQSI